MPPLPPAPQCVRVVCSGLNQTHPWANIFHLQYVGTAPTNPVLDGLCTSVSTLWSTTFSSAQLANTSLTQVSAVDLSGPSGGVGLSTAVHAGTDTGTGNLPVSVAAVITWKTALRWRGGHPRTYLTGIAASRTQNGNQWVPTFQSSLQTLASTFHTGLNSLSAGGNSWSHVVVRRHQTLVDGSHVVLNPAVPVPILQQFVDSRIDSQRRRLGPDVSA